MKNLVNDFDEKVHKAIPEVVRREKISKLLKELAEDLAQAVRRYEERHGEMLQIVITGDHLYTSLPGQANRLEIPSGSMEITHGRLARFSASELPPAGDSWYPLSGEQGYLPGAYLIARRYHYFGSKPKGAGHGGMTPEEVAVPVLTLSLQSLPQVELLSLSVVGEIYRRRESQVILKIGNPNRLKVSIEELKLEWTPGGPDTSGDPRAEGRGGPACQVRCPELDQKGSQRQWDPPLSSSRPYPLASDEFVPADSGGCHHKDRFRGRF